jgi:hypothetical protein
MGKQTTERFELRRVIATSYVQPGPPTGFSASSTFKSYTRSGPGNIKLPNWRKLVSNHESATTAFTGSDFGFSKSPGSAQTRRTFSFSPGVILSESYSGIPNILSSILPSTLLPFSGGAFTSARNEAISKTYNQIRSMASPAQAGEDIGEAGETLRMIRKPQAGLQDLVKHVCNNHYNLLKKAKWNTVKRLAKSLADLTLEYRFGLQPLLSDIAASTVALQNRTVMTTYTTFSAKGKSEAISNTLGSGTEGTIRYDGRATTRERYTVRYKGQCAETHHLDQRSFNASIGLTWREAIPTLYNLIPYTFLLDYVTNLGSFVSAFAVPWGSVAWCNGTYIGLVEQIVDISFSSANAPLYILVSQSPAHYEVNYKGVQRFNQSGMPFPDFRFEVPSTKQLENVAALLASRLPVIGNLTRALNRDSKGGLDREFKLATRDRSLKVPYPFHQP